MKVLIACAFCLVVVGGSCRAQTMSAFEARSRQIQSMLDAEDARVAKLNRTPEGRAALQAEAKERAARELANDPKTIARARAYKRTHRATIAGKKTAVPPVNKQPATIAGAVRKK